MTTRSFVGRDLWHVNKLGTTVTTFVKPSPKSLVNVWYILCVYGFSLFVRVTKYHCEVNTGFYNKGYTNGWDKWSVLQFNRIYPDWGLYFGKSSLKFLKKFFIVYLKIPLRFCPSGF